MSESAGSAATPEAGDEISRLRARLDKAEHRLATAQRLARLGDWEVDLRSGLGWWSDELCAIYGVPPGRDDITSEEFLDIVHPEDRAPRRPQHRHCGRVDDGAPSPHRRSGIRGAAQPRAIAAAQAGRHRGGARSRRRADQSGPIRPPAARKSAIFSSLPGPRPCPALLQFTPGHPPNHRARPESQAQQPACFAAVADVFRCAFVAQFPNSGV